MLWKGVYIEAKTLSNHLRMHFITTLILVFAVCLGTKEIVSHINVCLWLTERRAKPFSFSGSHFGKTRQRRIQFQLITMFLVRKLLTPGAGGPERFQELFIHLFLFIPRRSMSSLRVFAGSSNPKKELKTLLDLHQRMKHKYSVIKSKSSVCTPALSRER